MSDTELPWVFTQRLEKAQIPYMVVGAFATMAFGVYRTTIDLDLVLDLKPTDWQVFQETFPTIEFYRPPRETFLVESARLARGHFNLIHQATQERADCYLAGKDALQHWGLRNRIPINLRDRAIWVAPPELVILKKLEFFREGGSPKHKYDIQGICGVVEIDRAMIEAEVDRMGLHEQWLVCQPPKD